MVTAVLVALGASTLGQLSPTASQLDCGGPPPQPSVTWRWVKNASPIPGHVRQAFYLNIGVFGPPVPMNCACGFAYSGPSINGLIQAGNADVVIFDAATQQEVGTVPELSLNLQPSAVVTNALNANPLGTLPPNLNWFGWGGLVPAFTAPALLPNQQFQFCFRIDVPIALDPLLKLRNGWAAGGIGDVSGVPIFDPQVFHHVEAFSPNNPVLNEPSPGVAATIACAGLVTGLRRRRPAGA